MIAFLARYIGGFRHVRAREDRAAGRWENSVPVSKQHQTCPEASGGCACVTARWSAEGVCNFCACVQSWTAPIPQIRSYHLAHRAP